MAKTRLLSEKELIFYRTEVLSQFKRRHPENGIVNISTYREAYEELRHDILQRLPEKALSVSLNRLRKLFYYTNPKICRASQLQNPSFGKDFLEVLDQYIATLEPKADITQVDKSARTLTFKKSFLVLPLLIISIGIAVLFSIYNLKNQLFGKIILMFQKLKSYPN